MKVLALALIACIAFAGDKKSTSELIELSRKPARPEFSDALRGSFPAEDLRKGVAVVGDGPDFLFALETDNAPQLVVDDQPGPSMRRAGKSNLWFATAKLETGLSHSFYYLIDKAAFGGKTDVPAYGPESYEKPGVPHGTLSGKMVFTSKIYDGMKCDYWVYVPAQYAASTPVALMVWQDGHTLVQRDGNTRAQIVFDNLTAASKIPVMIHVFIDPGTLGEKSMRGIEYDTVSDRFARFLRDEILPVISSNYNIRKDAYSRAIAGNSSGGICAFNVAWFQPDQFSRVLSRIGSFTNLQQNHPGEFDGGNTYPFRVRTDPKRNIRVWLQDGSGDLENPFGSWPMQNIQMANSLKFRDYDFHFSFGSGTHNGAHGNAELPAEMLWLWSDYDASKTSQEYEPATGEKDLPFYRVRIASRPPD